MWHYSFLLGGDSLDIGYLVISYMLGSVMTAKIVGAYYGVALEREQSGNLGARNAGRVLGKRAFFYTATGDIVKALLVVFIGRWLQLDSWLVALGLTSCVIGHLYPVWLKGRGGKGVASLLGGLFLLSPATFAIVAVVIGIGYFATKSITIGFVFSLLVLIVISCVVNVSLWPLAVSSGLVLWKHRINIRERWT